MRSLADALELPADERAALFAAVPKRSGPSPAPAAAPGPTPGLLVCADDHAASSVVHGLADFKIGLLRCEGRLSGIVGSRPVLLSLSTMFLTGTQQALGKVALVDPLQDRLTGAVHGGLLKPQPGLPAFQF